MSTKIVNLSLPHNLVALVDAQAKLEYATRSEYIKRAIISQLKTENIAGNLASNPLTIANAKRMQLQNFLKEYYDEQPIDKIH